ncbi:MAG: M1 family metallopeptidase [Saprospiraceae bacterium]|nr:M1 family metallopeptidase [Saprospiraceae bacterium]
MKRLFVIATLVSAFAYSTDAQEAAMQEFGRADSLRGTLSEFRSNYDVQFYDLEVELDIPNKSLKGANTIVFKAEESITKMQVDLFENMNISKVTHGNATLPFTREYDAVFINLDKTIKRGVIDSIRIEYDGTPIEAIRPPWESGFVWAQDSLNNPWISVTSEGEGASLWWPNKDHLSDEPDNGVKVSITVPDSLKAISNGRLIGKEELDGGRAKYIWRNKAPINNYNVALYVGDYVTYKEYYNPRPQLTAAGSSNNNSRTLDMDFYVLRYNLDKAKQHFEFTEKMFMVFETFFGPYPFYEDGYAVVEAPYLGMEHQAAIAYGNNYQFGWNGELAIPYIEFDYLLVHETAHEWWGNNVSAADIADLWIHESFTTYADAAYVFSSFGLEGYKKYMDHYKTLVKNDKPIIGQYDVNDHKASLDAYYKGALMLGTISQLVESNRDWFGTLQKIQQEFAAPRTISTEELQAFMEQELRIELDKIFDQYLRTTEVPTLRVKLMKQGKDQYAVYRWENVVEGFDMPIKMKTGRYDDKWIYPTEKWKKAKISKSTDMNFFGIDDRSFYINLIMEE